MPPDKEIIELLYARRKQHGGWNSEWYAGVASDPRERLFKHHRVDEASGAWAFEPTESAQDARRLAKSFHSGGGFDGELGDDDPAAVYVYIYLKTKDTKQ
jgi:hypothetical protein